MVLLGTVIINICHMGTNYRSRALIDSGSEATFITEHLFNIIKLPFQTVAAQSTRQELPSYPIPQGALNDCPTFLWQILRFSKVPR